VNLLLKSQLEGGEGGFKPNKKNRCEVSMTDKKTISAERASQNTFTKVSQEI